MINIPSQLHVCVKNCPKQEFIGVLNNPNSSLLKYQHFVSRQGRN